MVTGASAPGSGAQGAAKEGGEEFKEKLTSGHNNLNIEKNNMKLKRVIFLKFIISVRSGRSDHSPRVPLITQRLY